MDIAAAFGLAEGALSFIQLQSDFNMPWDRTSDDPQLKRRCDETVVFEKLNTLKSIFYGVARLPSAAEGARISGALLALQRLASTCLSDVNLLLESLKDVPNELSKSTQAKPIQALHLYEATTLSIDITTHIKVFVRYGTSRGLRPIPGTHRKH